MRIAISGPGRSGSSLLVEILSNWGFTAPGLSWYSPAEAGLERRLGDDSPFEVDKDPWAFEYIHKVDLSRYDWVIIPLRNRHDATISRSVQERYSRLLSRPDDYWMWGTGGSVAGGAVVDSSYAAISQTLAEGFWDLLSELTRQDITPIFLDFPRFAMDFDYLWRSLENVVQGRIQEKEAREVWAMTVDVEKLRASTGSPRQDAVHPDELFLLVEMLRKEMMRFKSELDSDGSK